MTLDYEIYKEGGLLKDRYQKLEDISEGSYGYVSLAKDTELKKLVAVKYIFKTEESYEKDNDNDATKGSNNSSVEKQKMLLKRQRSLISERVRSRLSRTICFEALYEVDIQSKIGKHKNITELFDYFDSYIIMEYCSGGDLYEAIKADIIPRKTKQLSHIISQIMDAVEYVHSKGIYHRDIKPENILIADSNWTIKLTDWGLATTERTSMDRNVGSERYMAPELFESNLDYDERNEPYDCSKVDIWAIGIVLLNIVFHKNPFSVANQTDKSFCYFAANREALFDVFSTMSYDFFQLLRHSLTIDPTNRYLSSMREELSRLGEYTLDDECYNSLSEDGEEMVSEGEESYARPTRFQEVDSTHTTNTPYSETDSPPLPLTMPVSVPVANTGHITPAPSKNEGKDPIPKFTFTKRSHPKPPTYSEKNTKPIRIKNNRKIIKNTRKPLGIPTPNSHINNYFHEYNSYNDSADFNTKDFYTPPSVHNKYMEGVFSKRNKHRRNSHQYYSNDHNNGRPSSANAAARPFQNAGSYGNNNNNNNNITSMNNSGRRRSSISAQSSQPNGKYVPPHSRNSTSNSSPNNIIPPHDGSSPKGGSTYHEQHRLALDAEPEVDDVLFTLEESDVDNNLISDMSNLTVHEQSSYNRGRLSISMDNYGAMNGNHLNTGNGNHTYVPDLLKSPQSPTDLHNHLKNFNFNMNSNARRQSTSEYKPKPGVYIPPHHRKSINQYSYNTLSSSVYGVGPTLSINSENYGSGAGTRKGSSARRASAAGTMFNSVNNHNNNINKFDSQSTKFHKPYMPYNHAVSTTAIQNADVFAHTNSVVFEDDVDAPPTKRKSIHVQSLPKIKSGRKSSIQNDLVGSLEQYKNNWLILQQHQE